MTKKSDNCVSTPYLAEDLHKRDERYRFVEYCGNEIGKTSIDTSVCLLIDLSSS